MERTNGSHINYRYGICLNDNCPKCKAKEVQKVSIRKDFVCSECGKNLMECPPPKGGAPKKIIILVVALIIIVAAICYILFGGKKKAPESNPMAPADSAQVDSASTDSAATESSDTTAAVSQTDAASAAATSAAAPAQASAPAAAPAKAPAAKASAPSQSSKNGHGTVNLGYATYTGDLKNGQPHGQGTLTYKSSHKIVSSKDYVASPGDRFEGEFRDGMISSIGGYWYHDGNTTYVKP